MLQFSLTFSAYAYLALVAQIVLCDKILPAHSETMSKRHDAKGEEVQSSAMIKSYPLRKDIKVAEQAEGEPPLTTSSSESKRGFPTTLAAFGYYFNAAGELRQRENDEPFEFNVIPGNRDYNQQHYEALGDVITEYVYSLLETRCGLVREHIPVSDDGDTAAGGWDSFFFHSPHAFQSDKLLLLIHGSGVVRAGQWARSLIINDKLDSGTQIPYIERALRDGYGVVVTNTNEVNHNRSNMPSTRTQYTQQGGPNDHADYIWQHFIKPSSARHIAIVAHSYGGVVTASLLKKYWHDFRHRVFAVAFTDSVHSSHDFNKERSAWMRQHGRNWVTSSAPVDTPVGGGDSKDVPRVSAGHVKHEMTSWTSFHSIFDYLEQKLGDEVSTSASPPKSGASSPKSGTSSPGTDKSSPKIRKSSPKSDTSSPKSGTSSPRTDKSSPKIRKSSPKACKSGDTQQQARDLKTSSPRTTRSTIGSGESSEASELTNKSPPAKPRKSDSKERMKSPNKQEL